MKKLIFTCCAIVVACALAADPPKVKHKKKSEMTPQELIEAKAEMLKRTGGMILVQQKGEVKFINLQKTVSNEIVTAISESIGKVLRINSGVEAKAVDFDITKAGDLLAESKANACIFWADDPRLPMSLIAPESKWALLNIAALNADKPDMAKLNKRAQKMAMRVSAILLGAATSKYRGSALESIQSVKDVDNMAGNVLLPDSLMAISNHLPKLGITQGRVIAYRRACMEGVAPSPTNDIQKAVWDQVHAIPTKPIKIEFDPKTDTK